MHMSLARTASPPLLLLFLGTLGLGAQLPSPKLGISAGASHYSFGGVESSGTTAIGALRLELPLLFIVADGSLGLFRPKVRGQTNTFIVPELQVQWQFSPIGVRPYLGLGAGWLHPTGGPAVTEMTYSAAAGVRAGIPFIPLGFRAEARHRILGSSLGRHATELTLGVSW